MAEDETRDPSNESQSDSENNEELSSADGFPEHPVVENSESPESFESNPKEKSSGGGSRVLVILMIAVLAGGEFFLYQGQVNTRNEVLARLDQFQDQLNQYQQPPDVGIANQAALKKLQRDFQNFQSKVVSDLGSQHETLEAVESSIQDLADRPSLAARPAPTVIPPSVSSTPKHEAGSSSASGSKANPKKEYIEFVESTGAKMLRLAREGAIKLFEYFASLFK